MYFSANRRTYKAIFMQKTLKMTKNVNFMTSLWRQDIIWENFEYHFWNPRSISFQIGYKVFFHGVGIRAKFGETKKSRDFAYFYHISLYKIDPRAEFHKIRYLNPVHSTNSLNIWFLWLPMTHCNFLWGSLDGPTQNVAPNKFVCQACF